MRESDKFSRLAWVVAILSPALALTVPGSAEATVKISTTTTNMNCSGSGAGPFVCTPTKKNATLSVTVLQDDLAAGNVTVTTGGSLASDIQIVQGISWDSSNTLTLDAYHSISVTNSVQVNETGGLTLITNDGGTGGSLSFTGRGSFRFYDTASSLMINEASYTLVNSVNSPSNAIANLASDIASSPSTNYALGTDAAGPDLTGTCTLVPATFSGIFEGLGHQISGLTLNYTGSGGCSQQGLFASLEGGTIADVNLAVHQITCSSSAITDCADVGALAAYLDSASQIRNVSVTAAKTLSVTTAASTGGIGGSVGVGGAISGSSSAVKLMVAGTANQSGGIQVGGLAGNALSITGSTVGAGAKIQASNVGAVGGLAGAAASIDNSKARNSVQGNNVQGMTIAAGGLVGQGGSISQSFATGAVSTTEAGLVGGLAGLIDNGGSIVESYAMGNVTGNQNGDPAFNATGGLVGEISGCGSGSSDCIDQAYEIGQVTSTTSNPGGLIGYDDGTNGALVDAYWDTTTSGITNPSQGAGNVASDPGITGLSSLQGSLPAGFSSSVWKEKPTVNNGYPYLIDNLP